MFYKLEKSDTLYKVGETRYGWDFFYGIDNILAMSSAECDYLIGLEVPEGARLTKNEIGTEFGRYEAQEYKIVSVKKFWTLETIKELIDNGALYAHKTLEEAILTGNTDMFRHLIDNKLVDISGDCGDVMAQNAVEMNDLETLKYLESKGVDIAKISTSLLMDACGKGDLEISKYLISKGANILEVAENPFTFPSEAFMEYTKGLANK